MSRLNVKIVETIDLISAGTFSKSSYWDKACRDITQSIEATDWPHGSRSFTIRPGKHINGVVPIKKPCLRSLKKLGWETEALPELEPGVLTSGDIDALLQTPEGYIGFEWETGNISSSHRALNKLFLALHDRAIVGGSLVVPSAALYKFLTDRVGNITELRPYFRLWRTLPITDGCLRIYVVEHDSESPRVRKIPKGTDGRAMR